MQAEQQGAGSADIDMLGSTSTGNMIAGHYLSGMMPSPLASPTTFEDDDAAPSAPPYSKGSEHGSTQQPRWQDAFWPSKPAAGSAPQPQQQQQQPPPGPSSWEAQTARASPQSPFLAAQASVEPRSASSRTERQPGAAAQQHGSLAAAAEAALQSVFPAARASRERSSAEHAPQANGRRAVLCKLDTAYRLNPPAAAEAAQPDQAAAPPGGSAPASEAGSHAGAQSCDGRSGSRATSTPESSGENLSAAGGPDRPNGRAPSAAMAIPVAGAAQRPPAAPAEGIMVRATSRSCLRHPLHHVLMFSDTPSARAPR
jgi:hypothetical protein